MSTMCKLSKKYLGKDNEKYFGYLDKAKYVCTRCGRVANDEKNLCRPKKLEELRIDVKKADGDKGAKKKKKLKESKKVKDLKIDEFREIIKDELKEQK